ncbi:MAG: alpha/beta hydrolase [Duncaniella sp.]|nr:alpha/beta hydrolase [Duncaniella sp.]
MRKLFPAFFALLLALPCAGQEAVPRDTSFTLHSAYKKIERKYPYARPVSQSIPEGVTKIADVVYRHFDSTQFGPRDLHFDIFRADTVEGLRPAVLMIHGGGWNSGDRSLQYPLAAALAKRGYVAVPVEYRLTPESRYPAGLHDIKAAVRWVHENGTAYGIDTTRIALSGCSAGGQLAALAGITNGSMRHEGPLDSDETPSHVSAVVCIDGITTFVSDYNISDVYERREKHNGQLPVNALWLGGMPDEADENWQEASAINWVTPASAPVCFINSDLPRYRDGRDEIRPLLDQAGVHTEIHSVNSPIHPFWLFYPWYSSTVTHAADFLDRVLKK